MSSLVWIDSSSRSVEEMCQSNDLGKLPWCGKTSRSPWWTPHLKETKPCRTKVETRQRNTGRGSGSPEKCAGNGESGKGWKVKGAPEGRPGNTQKKRCCDKKRVEMSADRWREYSIVAAVSFLCYMNAFFGDFVHDDVPAITRNRDVTGQTPVLQVLRNDFWGTAMSDPSSHKSYRPLTTFSFR
ncbi:hypothetical protein RUM43_005951 [Polyplax serrata]|uniref:Uncharacterized protein n=1 Tax=Polyplax serrata TaxID=468196 RepID=A0AAN8NR53_POLSC